MLTRKQKNQFSVFVASFIHAIRVETNATYEQAETVTQLAAAILFGAVFGVVPDDDETPDAVDVFALGIIGAALRREYAVKVHD